MHMQSDCDCVMVQCSVVQSDCDSVMVQCSVVIIIMANVGLYMKTF